MQKGSQENRSSSGNQDFQVDGTVEQKKLHSRRDMLLFGGLTLGVASVGYGIIDGPERGELATEKVAILKAQNEHFVKQFYRFLQEAGDYNQKADRNLEDFSQVLESYYKLILLYGKTLEFAYLFDLNPEKVIKSHKTISDIQKNKFSKKIKEDMEKIDEQVSLTFRSFITPSDNKSLGRNFRMLEDSELSDPEVQFDLVYSQFNPATSSLYEYRDVMVRMGALLGAMESKSKHLEDLKDPKNEEYSNKFKDSNRKFVSIKTEFFRQCKNLAKQNKNF